MSPARWIVLLAAVAAAGCGASNDRSYRANMEPPRGPTTVNLDAGGAVTTVMPTPGGIYAEGAPPTYLASTANAGLYPTPTSAVPSGERVTVATVEPRRDAEAAVQDRASGDVRTADRERSEAASTAPRTGTLPKTASAIPIQSLAGLLLVASAGLVRLALKVRR